MDIEELKRLLKEHLTIEVEEHTNAWEEGTRAAVQYKKITILFGGEEISSTYAFQ